MFRHLRSKIIVSFCLLMIAGGVLTIALVQRNLAQAFSESVDRNALTLASTLAVQLTEPLAYADRLAVKQILVRARETSRDTLYLYIVAPDGRILGHSFSGDRFPRDLLRVALMLVPATVHVETGVVRDLSVPIAEGILGRLHIGSSMSWAQRVTLATVQNVALMTALAMLVGILGILILAQLITRPILALTASARDMERGGALIVAPVEGRDEVADLAVAFNSLVLEIRARISESNELRAYVENVINHLSSSVIVVEESGLIEYANRMAVEWYGDLVGQTCEEALATARPEFMTSVNEVLETGEMCRKFSSSPSGRTYKLTYTPMEGGDGRRMVVETASDVTEQREMANRLQRAERLAVAGELAAGVVHTINNPLDGVRRALQLAPKGLEDFARTTKLLALADEGCARIAKVTHTLLGFARGDTGVERVLSSLADLAQEAIELVQFKASAKNVTIRCELASDLPDIVVDPEGIKEVFVNLLMNGIDACREEGGEIVVQAARLDRDWIEIAMIDNGMGVDPEVESRIFEPFVTMKEIGQGTGLGLSIVRRIVDAHAGEVSVESTPGGGATFRIRLPVVAVNRQKGEGV